MGIDTVNYVEDKVWAIIPARGGSKSIPLKNLADLGGHPLIHYAIRAAQNSHSISRIICSTDHEEIAGFCRESGIEVQERPTALAQDNVPTLHVVIHFIETLIEEEEEVAGAIVLLEPTSPFVLASHIDDCVALLREDTEADSVQSITEVTPNHHAYNQRYLEDGLIHFRFKEEREGLFNKQLKPEFFVHGNLRVLRSASVLANDDLYGDRSLPYVIPRVYATDVDGPEDLELAELLLASGAVSLNS